jgi:tetratricopeptide (TPR) repeat protein
LESTQENQLGEIFTLINISDVFLLDKLYSGAIIRLNRCEDILNSIPNKTYQIELITAISQLYERKGILYLEQELFEDALKEFQKGLDQLKLFITDEDIKLLPANKSASIRIYVLSLNNIANTYLKLIEKDKVDNLKLVILAIENLQKSRLISESHFRKHPYNLIFKLDIADTLSSLAYAYFLNNELSKSNNFSLKNIEIMEQLINFNPDNREYIINLAKSYSNYANHLYQQYDYPNSVINYQKCVTLTQNCKFSNLPEIQSLYSISNQMSLKLKGLI